MIARIEGNRVTVDRDKAEIFVTYYVWLCDNGITKEPEFLRGNEVDFCDVKDFRGIVLHLSLLSESNDQRRLFLDKLFSCLLKLSEDHPFLMEEKV